MGHPRPSKVENVTLCHIFIESTVCGTGAYDVACEHEHSCCVLCARRERFFKSERWHTWIDYDKFHKLLASGAHFTSEDYLMETPHWAVYGAPEAGFDPEESRFKKQRRHKRDGA